MKTNPLRFAFLLLAAAVVGCSGQPSGDSGPGEAAQAPTDKTTAGQASADQAPPEEAVPARTWPEGTVVIGEPIQEGEPVQLAAVKADPSSYFEKTILVEATASAICQAKGCWMTIADADGEGEPIWVRWSTGCGSLYAFPKDAAGRRIIVQGSFYEKEIDEAAAEHLAAENDKIDAEEIKGKTFEMNATGCVLLPAEDETKGV